MSIFSAICHLCLHVTGVVVTAAQVQGAVTQLLSLRQGELQAKRYALYGELLGSLTKDTVKWADPREVKAALDQALESTIGPRGDAQPSQTPSQDKVRQGEETRQEEERERERVGRTEVLDI